MMYVLQLSVLQDPEFTLAYNTTYWTDLFVRHSLLLSVLQDPGFTLAHNTTYWTDLFVRHFLFQPGRSGQPHPLLRNPGVANPDSYQDLTIGLQFKEKSHQKWKKITHVYVFECSINLFGNSIFLFVFKEQSVFYCVQSRQHSFIGIKNKV